MPRSRMPHCHLTDRLSKLTEHGLCWPNMTIFIDGVDARWSILSFAILHQERHLGWLGTRDSL